ncbi:phosphate ABC transporter permease subunit PstC [Pseudooceanicola sp. CBS1P-1]|uniref:Phosphate transport system permease protein n=1 Tax=Pseudooceanicola albus TaxID=2692189 RepID=A0A6L7G142_9RHOB|nr:MULTISPECIES: phosphate ABC transporter permease subunit PstC [Pseudooceanicola]MBT9383795.1 phosphate ABC transporter permease subunit PstC [Pseudooceanicola endophyticus]MXN17649.1 phosphate ABC transporter permease subunit PstC [Pseudooceanicola albus]
MPASWIFLIVVVLAAIGYVLARGRALASAQGDSRHLHSLPSYYGMNAALLTAIPALILLGLWLIAQPVFVEKRAEAFIPADAYESAGQLSLMMSDVHRIAAGLDAAVAQGVLTEAAVTRLSAADDVRGQLGKVGVALGSDVDAAELEAARSFRSLSHTGDLIRDGLVVLLALAGFGWALKQTNKDFRARNAVEKVIKGLLVLAASLAILTTVGIVLSLLFNTVEFFKLYPAKDFFFGLTWSPSFGGGSELGILPLLWGTLYISLIALLVAVPLGLFAAIYLSEYASPAIRGIAKPLIEVLAGIPTIVYGLFALVTIGPLLMKAFGEQGGLGWMAGGTAVMTAGLAMGIMLIPFVSSLSDDIINAVPQSLRDGSLGLGATKSETIKQVVLPAALPGIVGAVLLAASRAIGETMIVVMGAGAAAKLSLNPFDAMTTVTAKIVSQLTGDADFASPEALVAFSLGMSLFVITLALNIFALWIVRKYREQYE